MPGRTSACQKKEMGPVIAPVGLLELTLSSSVTPAADTVSSPSSVGVSSSIVSTPSGEAFEPSTTSA